MSTLYIVATPIGNLEDISLRALRVLREADFIICEDTRVTAKLLAHYEIKKPLVSYHHHTKLQKIDYIIERLKKGESAALVSDAGTPGISDPGGVFVEYANQPQSFDGAQRKSESESTRIKVVPVPGANAAVTLASASGIPMDKFLFLSFPPHKKGRQSFFKKVLESEVPVIFYESCHRILKALGELGSPLSQRGDRGDFSNAGTVNIKNGGVRKAYDKEIRAEAVDNEESLLAEKSPRLPCGQPTPFGKGGNQSLLNKGLRVIIGRELTKMFETIYRGTAEEVIRELESDKNNLKGEFTVIVFNKINESMNHEIICR